MESFKGNESPAYSKSEVPDHQSLLGEEKDSFIDDPPKEEEPVEKQEEETPQVVEEQEEIEKLPKKKKRGKFTPDESSLQLTAEKLMERMLDAIALDNENAELKKPGLFKSSCEAKIAS